MIKKLSCLFLVLVLIATISLIGVSAAETSLAETGSDTKIYFEVPSDWKNYKSVFCHIWEYGSPTPLASFQSKKEKCTLEDDGRWSYDTTKVGGLEAGKCYGMLFSLDTMMQTYDTIMTTACLGDTLYCNDTIYENPTDSSKTCRAAFFRNKDASQYGPLMQITSIGNLIGTCLPYGVTATDLMSSFLVNTLGNARQYSGKTDQEIIDGLATGLGLSQDTTEELIKESGISVEWEKAKSDAPTEDIPVIPGSTSAVATGQDMTTVYIAVGVMLLSAAAATALRKKLFRNKLNK